MPKNLLAIFFFFLRATTKWRIKVIEVFHSSFYVSTQANMKTFIFAFLAFTCLLSGAQAAKCLVYGDIAHANGGDSAFWNAFPSIQAQYNLMSCRRALGQPTDHVPAIQYCE